MQEARDSIYPEVSRLADSAGVSEAAAAMRVMIAEVMSMARDIPSPLRPALVQACARWFADLQSDSLEPARVECWKYLKEKNGNSTTIDDRADIAIRALICVLWDEPLDHDLDLAVDFFDTLIQRYAVIRPIRWDSEPDIRE